MSFTATIPNPAINPFLSTTSLPEGTLFIVVGSILLGIILIVLFWRIYAIWASHRAATYNEARFTALEPSYGGPFVDPVDHRSLESDDDLDYAEKGPELHPVGVPLNPNSKNRQRKRTKSQVERMREAQMQGKFFSPTADVLLHGAPTSAGSIGNLGSSANLPSNASTSRLSIIHSGRNSVMQHSSMSSTDLAGRRRSSDATAMGGFPGFLMGPPSGSSNPPVNTPLGPPTGHYRTASSLGTSAAAGEPVGSAGGPYSGSSNDPSSIDSARNTSRPRKIRPPSTYLDDLIG